MTSKLNLILDDYIKSEVFGNIYIPSVQDVLNIGEEQLSLFLLPWRMSLDILNIDEDTKKDLKVFDLFFQNFKYDNNLKYYDSLMNSLNYYFRNELICFNKRMYQIEMYYLNSQNKWNFKIINRDNFDKLADIILKINDTERIKKHKEPSFTNDIQKDIYYKIQEGRRKKAEKNRMSIGTIINIIMHGGKSFITYTEIKTWTLPQLFNSFNAIMAINGWDVNFQRYLGGADPKKDKLDLTYWVSKIKI